MEDRSKSNDLKLLATAFFKNLTLNDREYGGIGLDSKRPFGNSDVTTDILEIIKMEPYYRCQRCGDNYSKAQMEYADALYKIHLIPYLQEMWHNFSITRT